MPNNNIPQNLLTETILFGFTMLVTSLCLGLPAYFFNWPAWIMGLALILLLIGFILLVAAWQIRQGLVSGYLVLSLVRLRKLIKKNK